ncbi:bZIP transcription factor [Nitzschia inconspicua]|uniref:BZIP transcription factor n=1 Tax=Nitzschia inconspicua TaxID=303405 RepID=A0A9K3LFY1_9STRA|nr:bZIP transcription factor [Nitzschia inconspicua]
MVSMATDPAEARKRRKEIIQSQRSEGEASTAAEPAAAAPKKGKAAAAATSTNAEKKPPKKRKVTADDDANKASNAAAAAAAAAASASDSESVSSSKKKTQIRYDPEVPMSKEQLAAWRREARRVRNRESAAASRQRIRSRISELEEEVSEWKSKYGQAMQRLEALEAAVAAQPSGAPAADQAHV